MRLRMRLKRLEARLARPGRCRVCYGWPPPLFRLLDASDPAAVELPPHTACAACGWRYRGVHTIIFKQRSEAEAEGTTTREL